MGYIYSLVIQIWCIYTRNTYTYVDLFTFGTTDEVIIQVNVILPIYITPSWHTWFLMISNANTTSIHAGVVDQFVISQRGSQMVNCNVGIWVCIPLSVFASKTFHWQPINPIISWHCQVTRCNDYFNHISSPSSLLLSSSPPLPLPPQSLHHHDLRAHHFGRTIMFVVIFLN